MNVFVTLCFHEEQNILVALAWGRFAVLVVLPHLSVKETSLSFQTEGMFLVIPGIEEGDLQVLTVFCEKCQGKKQHWSLHLCCPSDGRDC